MDASKAKFPAISFVSTYCKSVYSVDKRYIFQIKLFINPVQKLDYFCWKNESLIDRAEKLWT